MGARPWGQAPGAAAPFQRSGWQLEQKTEELSSSTMTSITRATKLSPP